MLARRRARLTLCWEHRGASAAQVGGSAHGGGGGPGSDGPAGGRGVGGGGGGHLRVAVQGGGEWRGGNAGCVLAPRSHRARTRCAHGESDDTSETDETKESRPVTACEEQCARYFLHVNWHSSTMRRSSHRAVKSGHWPGSQGRHTRVSTGGQGVNILRASPTPCWRTGAPARRHHARCIWRTRQSSPSLTQRKAPLPPSLPKTSYF